MKTKKKKLSENIRLPAEDLNPGTPEYESGIITRWVS
jgi:hypothetical protein